MCVCVLRGGKNKKLCWTRIALAAKKPTHKKAAAAEERTEPS